MFIFGPNISNPCSFSFACIVQFSLCCSSLPFIVFFFLFSLLGYTKTKSLMISPFSSLSCCCKTNLLFMKWKPKTPLFSKPLTPFNSIRSLKRRNSSIGSLDSQVHQTDRNTSTKHTTFLVETFHQTQKLKALLSRVQSRDSDPLQLLKDDGDWSKEQLWAVIRFLRETSRMEEALRVFDFWKNIDKMRVNVVNYMKIIDFLGKSGLMQESVSVLQDMKKHGLIPSVKIYNSIIHGFARKGEFNNARFFLENMTEDNLRPESETYDGLIIAYGNHKMYDEMCKCVKRMESEGFSPDQVTYNIMISKFAQGGLLDKMEGVHRTLLSKKMALQSSTLVAMLEAYVNFGILEKMEKSYRRVLSSKVCLKEGLIRKMAKLYLENYMFSRLEGLGLETASKTGKTYLVWLLLLLSNACLLSRKGMDSIIQEMERATVKPHVTFINIIALAYLNMKDFKHLDTLLCQLRAQNVKPDIITLGIAFDAYISGSERTAALDVWRRIGFLKEEVEMNTDPLVIVAFGKGHFVTQCEDLYASLGSKGREKEVWTYNDLIEMVFKKN